MARVARRLILCLALSASGIAAEAAACPVTVGPDARPAELRGVTAAGDIDAGQGRLAKAAGVMIWPEAVEGASALVSGQAAHLQGSADRWGRSALSEPATALAILQAGLGYTVVEDAPPGCARAFLAAEDGARRARRGFWASTARLPVDAASGDAVASRAGDYLIMQGRVAHVGWTRRAAYLNFGRAGEGASAELSSAVRRALEQQGWTREALRGQTVRVRGIVTTGRSARILVDSVEAVEWLR